jgi:hypothetical protein
VKIFLCVFNLIDELFSLIKMLILRGQAALGHSIQTTFSEFLELVSQSFTEVFETPTEKLKDPGLVEVDDSIMLPKIIEPPSISGQPWRSNSFN